MRLNILLVVVSLFAVLFFSWDLFFLGIWRRKADYLIFRKMANIFAIIFLLTITAALIESFITPALIGVD